MKKSALSPQNETEIPLNFYKNKKISRDNAAVLPCSVLLPPLQKKPKSETEIIWRFNEQTRTIDTSCNGPCYLLRNRLRAGRNISELMGWDMNFLWEFEGITVGCPKKRGNFIHSNYLSEEKRNTTKWRASQFRIPDTLFIDRKWKKRILFFHEQIWTLEQVAAVGGEEPTNEKIEKK